MRIAVVGAGVVGKATGLGVARFGHRILFGDINPEVLAPLRNMGFETWLFPTEPMPEAELYLICTPEEEAAGVVRAMKEVEGEIVIRSSTLPGTSECLARELGRSLLHNPEFLREATALDDFLNTSFAIIGQAPEFMGPQESFLSALYAQMGIPVSWTHATISELTKLVVNNYLATLISFWNEVHLLARSIGFNSNIVARLAAQDPRVSRYGAFKHGEAFGGRCLPKDLDSMVAFYRGYVGLSPVLLEAVRAVNLSIGGKSG